MTTPLGYDGQYTEPETGLVYERARVYDPATAQFLSVDPAESNTGQPYAYAADDPVGNEDPTGLCAARAASLPLENPKVRECESLSSLIGNQRQKLVRRSGEILNDRSFDPKNVAGHAQAFEQAQERLKKLLRKWDNKGCEALVIEGSVQGLAGDVRKWAERAPPSPRHRWKTNFVETSLSRGGVLRTWTEHDFSVTGNSYVTGRGMEGYWVNVAAQSYDVTVIIRP